jgi:pantetheine-phosphate adenylyltransferase
MSRIAVVPGSFDHNPGKTALLPIAQRVNLIEQSIKAAGLPGNIKVTSWSVGLLVDYCVEVEASVIVKGIRSQIDVAYETPMAIVNRNLAGVETVFLLPSPENAHVSSSLVRQVAGLGGDVSPYVPAAVAAFLQAG